jgi:DNA-directed RNA polymerase alpha subunit
LKRLNSTEIAALFITHYLDEENFMETQMTNEDRLDQLAMEAMSAAIVNNGIRNVYTLALDSYILATEMLKRRQVILEARVIGESSQFIEELELTMRTSNCLKEAKIHTVGQLEQWTRNELLGLPNLGRKSLKEVEEQLEKMGLKLRVPTLKEQV